MVMQTCADFRQESDARKIIEVCAHPDFRPQLLDYLERSCMECECKQTPQLLREVFADK